MNALDSVLDMFLELAAISSPSRSEREVADRVHGFLHQLGLETDEDAAGSADRIEIGNIHCRHAGHRGRPPDLSERPSGHGAADGADRAGVEDGVVTNASDTILGADNKAAVVAMLGPCATASRGPPHAGMELVFDADGGGRPAGSQAVRRLAAVGRVRILLRPRGADRPES